VQRNEANYRRHRDVYRPVIERTELGYDVKVSRNRPIEHVTCEAGER
jgi:hypothetical protein